MRIMRILVMFDLPTGTPEERRAQARFRRFLIEEGFVMEQFSVYAKVAVGQAAIESERLRIRLHCPPFGTVEVLSLTERQYAAREILVSDARHVRGHLGTQLTLDF